MLILRKLTRTSDKSASCAITLDGADYAFTVNTELLAPKVRGIQYADAPDSTFFILENALEGRAFGKVLIDYFDGEIIGDLPLEIKSDWETT